MGISKCLACNEMMYSYGDFCAKCRNCTSCQNKKQIDNLFCIVHRGGYCYDCMTDRPNICRACMLCSYCDLDLNNNINIVKCTSKNCNHLMCESCARMYSTCSDCDYENCGNCDNDIVVNFCYSCGNAICQSCIYGQILPDGIYCKNCASNCIKCGEHSIIRNRHNNKFYCKMHVYESVISCVSCDKWHRKVFCRYIKKNRNVCPQKHRCENCFDIITNCTINLDAEISTALLSMRRYCYPPRPIREYILRLAFNNLK